MSALGAKAAPAASDVALPLLGELWSDEILRARRIVLDLASASSRNINLFGELRCRGTMLGFSDWIRGPDATIPALAAGDPIAASIPLDPAHRPNAVLFWDFLNYLRRDQLTTLAARICEVGREGMLFHAMIAYAGDSMPPAPCHYRPTGRDRVQIQEATGTPVASPRYSPALLMKLMPGLEVHKARLLKNGYQEYLFRWSGSTSAKSVVVKGFDVQATEGTPIIARSNPPGHGPRRIIDEPTRH